MEMSFIKLKNRGLIHIEGADRHDFLQGLITNDIHKLTPQNPIYACLLNAQGKFLHDFFMIEGDNFTLLDCEGGERAKDLHKRLSMYRLRKDVQISCEEQNDVYAILSPSSSPRTRGSHDDKNQIPAQGGDNGWWADPRNPAMGFRTFTKPDLPEHPFEEWDRLRISLTIPDGSRDLVPEKSTMDEGDMDQLNAIDYEKGCYIGQELTARMHYRGLGKKKLKTISLKNNSIPGLIRDPEPETLDPDFRQDATMTDKNIIEIRSTCRDIGIALVKV